MEKIITIVPAAGAGKRLGLDKNKAFAKIKDVPLIVHCLKMLKETKLVKEVIVVVAKGEIEEAEQTFIKHQSFLKGLNWRLVEGGKERQDSVRNALESIEDDGGYIAVHDGARPFAGRMIFESVLKKALKTGAAIAAVPVKDTIKVIDAKDNVVSTPKRETLRAIQTPQIFKISLLKKAYKYLEENDITVTDDASLVEALGTKVSVVEGSYSNIKITTPEDVILAEKIIEKQELI